MATEPELKNFDFLDDKLQSSDLFLQLKQIVEHHPLLKVAFAEMRAGILVADISSERRPRWAAINPDLEIYGASVSKLGILLGILHNSVNSKDAKKDVLADFSQEISRMIKNSDNLESGKLYALTSLASIRTALFETGLYDWDFSKNSGRGGLWCGASYNTRETKEWFSQHSEIANSYPLDFAEQRSPKSNELFAQTSRSAARFLLLMESGRLINETLSSQAKIFLEKITTSKFLKGVQQDDTKINWYGKTGTFNGNLSEVALIEGEGYKYILSFLITRHRDNDVFEYLGHAVNRRLRLEGTTSSLP